MGLEAIRQAVDARKSTEVRCVVGKLVVALREVDPEAADELGQMLAAPVQVHSHVYMVEILNEVIRQLGIPAKAIGEHSVGNHRRKGCTCGAL